MRNTYILDTSVIVHDPNAFNQFPGQDIIIPIQVLDELDKLKTLPNETGKNARVCIKFLDKVCSANIQKGIKLSKNTILKIDTTITPDKFGTANYADNKILDCAFILKQKNDKKKITTKTILVSKDINLRVRAKSYHIDVEDYNKDKRIVNELHTGFVEIKNDEIGNILLSKNIVDCTQYKELENLYSNECVHVVSQDGRGLALGRRIGDKLKVIQNKKPWGLEAHSKEQAFAIDMLCDKKLPLVTLSGMAGGGKTIVALAAALEMVAERKEYKKLIIYRPIIPMGKDIGYLPGDLQSKVNPYMGAIFDNLEVLFSMKSGANWQKSMEYMLDRGIIEIDALTFIRGRSISNSIIILDEGQNCSKEEMKTILTRAGKDSKIILTGDPNQIDHKDLDATSNGLSYVVEKFKDSNLSGHMTFSKGERSELAEEAANRL